MPEEKQRTPRRRPIDVLFGEDVELKPKRAAPESDAPTQQTPGYMVEAARPVTNLTPPPPEMPNEWRVSAPPQPVKVEETPSPTLQPAETIAPPPKPPTSEPPPAPAPAEAVTFTAPPIDTSPRPKQELIVNPVNTARALSDTAATPAPPADTGAAAPAASAPTIIAAPLYRQSELLELSQFIDQLYQNVSDETTDSKMLSAECLARLNLARAALERGEYSTAETAAERVKARLLLARASRTAASSPTTLLLFAWLIVWGLLGAILLALPFAIHIVPVILPLLRAAGFGMVGGAVAVLWQAPQQIAKREFEAALASKYLLSPILGTLLGATMYLLSLLGILAAPNALGITGEPFLLMYFFAFVAGLFNDSIFGLLRGNVTHK